MSIVSFRFFVRGADGKKRDKVKEEEEEERKLLEQVVETEEGV